MAPGEHEALGPARFCFTREGLRAQRFEGREGLDQQFERLLEAAAPGGDAPKVRRRERDADRVVRRPPDSLGLREERLRLLELALVGEDLAHVVLRARDVDHVAHTAAQLAAAPVELGGLVPAARVVGLDSEVVDEARLENEAPASSSRGSARRACSSSFLPSATWFRWMRG